MQILSGWRGAPLLNAGEGDVQNKSYSGLELVKRLEAEHGDEFEQALDKEAEEDYESHPASLKALHTMYEGIRELHERSANHLDDVYGAVKDYAGHAAPAAARTEIHKALRHHQQKANEWHSYNQKFMKDLADSCESMHPGLERLDRDDDDDEDMD